MILFNLQSAKDRWTPETTRRSLRTFFQVFMGAIPGALAATVPEYGQPWFRFAVFVAVTSAVATGLAAAMNIEPITGGSSGATEKPPTIEDSTEEVVKPPETREGASDE